MGKNIRGFTSATLYGFSQALVIFSEKPDLLMTN
jgi:hypothetical protein